MIGEQVVAITKNNRIFPIKVEPACLLKWSWSTVYFNSGTSNSCHHVHRHKIDPDNFDNFHNLPAKIKARELMLDGQWPGDGCEYCQRVEESGGTSDRQHALNLQGDICQHPPELNSDPTATHTTPTILEVYFRNTCNMACVYCGPDVSSRWEEEDRKFNSNFKNTEYTTKYNDQFDVRLPQENPHYDKMVNDLWAYLEKDDRYRILRRYHILGGEPFLIPELDDSIEFWDQHPNQDLVFSIITNLNIPHERFKKYVDRFEKLVFEKKIWKFQITGSIDAWGPQQEYTRYGLDLSLWEKNFELMVTKPWVTLSINSALSALTIKQLPLLLEKINHWNSLRPAEYQTVDHVFNEPIMHSFNTTSQFDDPYIFGPGVFDQDFDKIIDLMPTHNQSQIAVKNQMSSIAQAVSNTPRDSTKINLLKDYLDKLDYRRKTNWRNIFPWLESY